MKLLPIFQVDAFTTKLFGGNPAAVVLLPPSLPYKNRVLQQIASENNLSETAFMYINKKDNQPEIPIRLRWFTPKAEVNLCGHATLASAFIYFSQLQPNQTSVTFHTLSGNLHCFKTENEISICLPKDEIYELEINHEIIALTDITPLKAYRGKEDLMLVFKNEEEVQKAIPNLSKVKNINYRGLIITAKGKKVDVVSRFFTPQLGINEDPVTGSAHTTLAAYWNNKLKKENLVCQQLSERGGTINCFVRHPHIELRGEAKLYLQGKIYTD